MTMNQLATIIGTIGGVNILTIISVIIAFLTYRHKVKKDAEDAAKAAQASAARAAAQFTKWDTDIGYIKDTVGELKEHDQAEAEARQKMQLDLVRIETKVDSHINDRSIHYRKSPAVAAGKRRNS